MTREEKGFYIRHLKDRYRRSGKKVKGEILSEIEQRLSISRKHAIRLLSAKSVGRPKNKAKAGRPPKYQGVGFKQALKRVWRLSGYMCSKSLQAAIPDWLPFIEAEFGEFDEELRSKLLSISPPTIDRVLKPYKGQKGKSLTKNSGFREEIPIQPNIWDIKTPGFIETDTVAHCGGSMLGEFINSLTVVDIATLWTDVNAVYGRGSTATFEALKQIESELPFEIKGYDTDNGGEVLNRSIVSYFIQERIEQGREAVQVTRSRPYKKNDNAHVEQRNDSIARRYLGYERFEFRELTELTSFYYRNIVCPLHNHFVPCFKLSEKIKVKSKTRRVYEKPQTPYKRIIESEFVPDDYKEKLTLWHNQLNPIALKALERSLRKQIDSTLRKLKAGIPLTSKDLAYPNKAVVRPVFDNRPLNNKALRQSTQQYAKAKNRLAEIHHKVF